MAKKKRNCGVFPPLSVATAEEWRRKRKTEGREPLKRGLISPSGEKEEDNKKKKFRLFPPAELGKTNGEEKKEEG